jgi:GH15 family glucan-1,4-alpha-glucosidase
MNDENKFLLITTWVSEWYARMGGKLLKIVEEIKYEIYSN